MAQISPVELLLLVGVVFAASFLLLKGWGSLGLRDWVRRHVRPWHLALPFIAFILACSIALFENIFPAVVALIFVAAVFVVWSWVREFSFLMLLSDDSFAGRFDKLIWAMLLIFLPPVGLFAFRSFRLTHWAESRKPSIDPIRDLC